ncbi:hypothetical protein B566_EDAN009969 [Ephemera danica]|nr:hypothetical protein B566_EDAN009969 [Ephemera danica]
MQQVKEDDPQEALEQISPSSVPEAEARTSTPSIPIARKSTVSAPLDVAGTSTQRTTGHRNELCSGGDDDLNRLDEQLLNKYPKYATLSSSLPTNPANRFTPTA